MTTEMKILSFHFFMYAVSGLWRPIEWSSTSSTLLYNLYTTFVVYLMVFLMLAQFLDLILIVDNLDDFVQNSLLFISLFNVMFKISTPLIHRSRIISLIKILQRPPCRVCNKEEMNIQTKFDRSIRSLSLTYASLAMVSATGGLIGLVFSILQGQSSTIRAWVPYDYSSPFLFWLTMIQFLLAIGPFGTFIGISTDILVYGLCLQACAQFEILTHRLQRTACSKGQIEPRESKPKDLSSNKISRLSKHICHHLCIIRYAKLVNDIYSQVFFAQFLASVLILCTSLYYLSSHLTLKNITTYFVYTLCMFIQILVYCWAGNEVTLKSTNLSDTIYQMDWIMMTINEQKDLLMIMKRSMRPIKFTSSFLVTLSLSSYGNLLKASYSAFNLLQQS